jgi:protein-disulfide isomerase
MGADGAKAAQIVSRFRTALDVLATVLLIVACLVVTRVALRTSWTAPSEPKRAKPDLSLPLHPVSLAGAPTLGSRTAPIAIIGYSDFECPFCAKFQQETLPRLMREYISPGRVAFAFKHLPLDRIHRNARQAAEAAVCANDQGRFWELHNRFFDRPKDLDRTVIRASVLAAGLDARQFEECQSGTSRVRVQADVAEAKQLGVSRTPTFLIGLLRSDGVSVHKRISGAEPFETVTG